MDSNLQLKQFSKQINEINHNSKLTNFEQIKKIEPIIKKSKKLMKYIQNDDCCYSDSKSLEDYELIMKTKKNKK